MPLTYLIVPSSKFPRPISAVNLEIDRCRISHVAHFQIFSAVTDLSRTPNHGCVKMIVLARFDDGPRCRWLQEPRAGLQ